MTPRAKAERTEKERKPLRVLPSPCTSCPYRRDTPAGVWDASEYAKLPAYDDGAENLATGVFLCHHSAAGPPTVCRGWLAVHNESVAVRLAVGAGMIDNESRYKPVKEPLYRSGAEAAAAGARGVRRPGKKARKVVASLVRRYPGLTSGAGG